MEADVRYPSDAVLALQGARALAREGRKLARRLGGEAAPRWSIAPGDRQDRPGDLQDAGPAHRAARNEVIELDAKAGRAGALGARGAPARAPSRASARGRGAQTKLQAAPSSSRWPSAASASRVRSGTPGRREDHRPARVTGRLRRTADPQGQARQARRVRLRRPDRRGDREHPSRRARLHPARRDRPGNPGREHPAPGHRRRARALVAQTARGGARRRLLASTSSAEQLHPSSPPASSSPGRAEPGSRRTRAPGPLPHRLRRAHQPPQTRLRAAPSRLKGQPGQQTWTGWAILTYNLDTLAVRHRLTASPGLDHRAHHRPNGRVSAPGAAVLAPHRLSGGSN